MIGLGSDKNQLCLFYNCAIYLQCNDPETAGKVCLAGSEWGVIGQKTTSQVIVQLYTVQQEGSGNSVLVTFKVSYKLRW